MCHWWYWEQRNGSRNWLRLYIVHTLPMMMTTTDDYDDDDDDDWRLRWWWWWRWWSWRWVWISVLVLMWMWMWIWICMNKKGPLLEKGAGFCSPFEGFSRTTTYGHHMDPAVGPSPWILVGSPLRLALTPCCLAWVLYWIYWPRDCAWNISEFANKNVSVIRDGVKTHRRLVFNRNKTCSVFFFFAQSESG